MSVSWIQWHDIRRPPPIQVDIDNDITVREEDPDDRNFSYLRDRRDEEGANSEIDEDKPIYTGTTKSSLGRSGSVGNSWGITSVGRGFDWKWKPKSADTDEEDDDKRSSSKSLEIASPTNDSVHRADDKLDATSSSAESDQTQDPSRNSLESQATTAEDSSSTASLNFSSHWQSPKSGEGRITSPGDAAAHIGPSPGAHPQHAATTIRISPFTPLTPTSFPPQPFSPTTTSPTTDDMASPRPVIAGRSQSMYVLPTGAPYYAEQQAEPASGSASPNLSTSNSAQQQRLRAWSRPVSPARSPTMPRLTTSPSAPSLNPLSMSNLFSSTMTPLIVTGGALTTPTTPRSPRLNRSRASQKRVSLIAGREVTGLSLLGTDGEPIDPEGEDSWLMFGKGRQGSPDADSNEEIMSASPIDETDVLAMRGRFGAPAIEAALAQAKVVDSRRGSLHTRSRPATPPPPEVAVEDVGDYHIGRAGQIKSLGRLNNSLLLDNQQSPPTPLRVASFVGGAKPTILMPDDEMQDQLSPLPGLSRRSSMRSNMGLVNIGTQEDISIPFEEEDVPDTAFYPSLDIPHPEWSLQRLSSSWSLSSSSHQHRHTSTSRSIRSKRESTTSPGRSPSSDPARGDEILTMMRRMKSSQSIKRMSSESGRRGGFLGGRTIDDYVISEEAGRGAYGLVKRGRERKKPVIGLDENDQEVILEDVKPNETVGPPLIIKQIIKSRILADCWKKHPIHGTIPIEIYVMSAVSGTSYVLPKQRAWDPRRFENEDEDDAKTAATGATSGVSSATVTPSLHTPTQTGNAGSDVKIEVTSTNPADDKNVTMHQDEEITELDLWRWREGELIKGHPNICPLEDFFEDASFYYLVLPATKPSFPRMPKGMEYTVDIGDRKTPNDLFDLVELYPSGLPGPLIRSYVGQIADALAFLHARGICHRDIKDENVVLGEHGRCWLIDFGSSGVIRKNGWDSFSGTLDYAAPEILHGARYTGPPQDVWAFGIVAYVLMVGECPFASSAESKQGLEDPDSKPALALRARCGGGPAGFDEGMERDGGGRLGDAMELVRRCLEVDPTARPTMEEIIACRYLNGGNGWGIEPATPDEDTSQAAPAS